MAHYMVFLKNIYRYRPHVIDSFQTQQVVFSKSKYSQVFSSVVSIIILILFIFFKSRTLT